VFFRKSVATLLVAGGLFAGASVAKASTVYSYSGNSFTVGGAGSVSGEFAVATPLGDSFNGAVTPAQFSFSAGALTLNNSNALAYVIDVQTSDVGAIVAWFISITSGLATITTSNFSDSASAGLVLASDSFNPGTWSISASPSATPLPASWTMMLSVMALGFGLMVYKEAGQRRRTLTSVSPLLG
jgi:hypothetical protein